MRTIEEKGGYFVQQIKKNCPATYQEIQNIFKELEKEKETSSCQVRIPKEVDADGNDVTPDKETFLKKGSRKCPKPTEGDGLTDQIQTVGLVSNHALTAEEFARYKRDHWRIENCLHHVLDEDFLEDKCTARKSKNTLSVLRKIAYNIIRFMQMEHPKDREQVIDVMDETADDFFIVVKWVFNPIPSFY